MIRRSFLLGSALALAPICEGVALAEPVSESHYVPGADGVLLAVDVWRGAASLAPMPAVVQFTRYWRAFRGGVLAEPSSVSALTQAGYAVVIVDVRGTGASFGAREAEFSDAEVADMGAVFDWIVRQPWSNGRLATLGTSYLGNTAELAAMTRHPALRAVVSRFSDFSEYRHAVRPGGVANAVIAAEWPNFVMALDRNDPCAAFMGQAGPDCAPGAPWAGGVRPVESRDDMLIDALSEHRSNANLAEIMRRLRYSDDTFHRDGRADVTLDSVSPAMRWPAIDAAQVPSFHWASWFDAGTAEGVLERFRLYQGPMRAVIGAWTHGGGRRADPFARGGAAPDPTPDAQMRDIIAFLNPLLKADSASPAPAAYGKEIRYFTLGVNTWRTSDVWPPREVEMRRWRPHAGGVLSQRAARAGRDVYDVDFAATTGRANRWHTQLGAPVDYGDRADTDRALLTYTSEPFTGAVELTGAASAQITLISSQPDGAIFVYLEAVLPDRRVINLAEGVRRLTFHQRRAEGASQEPRFTRAEARDAPVGEWITLRLSLSPISVVLPPDSRIRFALAGADADTFERLPQGEGQLRLTIDRRRTYFEAPTASSGGGSDSRRNNSH